MPDLAELQARLGYTFRDEGLLRLALTHPSVAHESGEPMAHNQRLEFLGDAVLQLILTHELYEKFPAFDEGPLTKGAPNSSTAARWPSMPARSIWART